MLNINGVIDYKDRKYFKGKPFEEPFAAHKIFPLHAYIDMLNNGSLFEIVNTEYNNIDMSDFVNRYMTSKTRYFCDILFPKVSILMGSKLLEEYLNYCKVDLDNFKKDYNKKIIKYQAMWIGEMYIRLGTSLMLPSEALIKLYPYEFLERYYINNHLIDPFKAAEDLINLTKYNIENKIQVKYMD